MNKISFSKYKAGDEKNAKLVLYNTGSLYSLSEATYTIKKDKTIIGFIDFGYFDKGELHIDLFEVIEKNNGYGTEIINEIKKCNAISSISVNPSSIESKLFWEKNGFLQETCEDWYWHG